jgi:hypothetical protein
MPARKPDPEGYNVPPGANHYNVCFKAGHILNRVRQRDLCEYKYQEIEWVWIVEAKRRATPDEIRPCKPGAKR